MAATAKTLETGIAAAFIDALGDRCLLLSLVGYYANAAGLTAKAAMVGAAAGSFGALSDKDLNSCILQAIYGTTSVPAPVAQAVGGGVVNWATTSSILPPYWNIYISTNGGTTFSVRANVAGTVFTMGSLAIGSIVYIQGVTTASGPYTPFTSPSNNVTVT